jgi:hypothetical protein
VRGAIFHPINDAGAVLHTLVRIRRETLTNARLIAA